MRLRVVGYQVQVRLRTLLPCFHRANGPALRRAPDSAPLQA